jgi:hypothetical protein
LGEYPVIKAWSRSLLEFVDGRMDDKPADYRPCGRLLPMDLKELRTALRAAEAEAVREANEKLTELKKEHRELTLAWAKATELGQGVLKEEIGLLEKELGKWEPQALPVTKRIADMLAVEERQRAERRKLLSEWSTLESREKGEALRRLFKKVTLFWEQSFRPARAKPTRPRKTTRPGRFSYSLRRDRIAWNFTASVLGSSC